MNAENKAGLTGNAYVAENQEDKIFVKCPSCGNVRRVGMHLDGKLVKCGTCKKLFTAHAISAPQIEGDPRIGRITKRRLAVMGKILSRNQSPGCQS